MNLVQELKDWGPEAIARQSARPGLAEAQLYCSRLSRSHYENFVVVGLFTPKRLRPAFEAIYAYCRWADDLGDETGDTGQSLALLQWWTDQLRELYTPDAPEPRHPVFIALKPVVKQFSIPITPFEDLVSAFCQDQSKTRYATYDELLDYCTRSANPVGELVLRLFGAASPENLAMSNDICTALQLANFWQDVSRDLDKGRIYIPLATMEQFQVTESQLREKPASKAFRDMLAYEVGRTRRLFEQGRPLTTRLKGRLGMALQLFHAGGTATLDAIEKCRFDVLTRRPKVGKMTQMRLMAQITCGIRTRRGVE